MSRGGGGRGRGRGRGKPPLEAALGLAPGEAAPPPILQPPPLFPPLDRRPLKLKVTEEEEYLVTVKQEMQRYMLQSPFHLSLTHTSSTKVTRYSDKYRRNRERNGGQYGWDINWNYFPAQLKTRPKKQGKFPLSAAAKPGKRKRGKSVLDSADVSKEGGNEDSDGDFPNPKRPRRRVTFDDKDNQGAEGEGEVARRLDSLEKVEQQLSAESEQSGGEEENPEEVYNEEDEEEGTDYNLTYFDNGEDFEAGGDEALEEGPVY